MRYKTKNETREYKKRFNSAMEYVQNKIPDLSFYYRLIGSGKRNLVIDKPNKGFDLDYQIIFYHSLSGLKSQELIAIKDRFRKSFDEFFVEKGYKHGEDSTSAITIVKLNGNKIDHSYDITLMSPNANGSLSIMKYQDSDKTTMGLNEMKKSIEFNKKYNAIKGASKWKELRDKYLEKQKRNNGDKKSFSLLLEVVNDIEL
ncbi:MAG: hypothetical protein ACOCQD_03165 [archaeon]